MAEPVWIGGAARTPQSDTITVALTWATADTVVITIGGEDVTVTIGAADTSTANVATAIKDAINATAALDGTGNTDATSDRGGQEINEFKEITATVASSVVSVTTTAAVNASRPGKPFTMSVVETTAGNGTSVEATATAATGPHHADNIDNWLTTAKPANSDIPVFDNRALYDCLYGLNASAVALTSLTITNGFRKKIGLPQINADSTASQYPEYRDTYYQIGTALLTFSGEGNGSERINLDLGSATACTANIDSNGRKSGGQGAEATVPPVLLIGTNAANILRVTKGNVGVAFYNGEAAHLATLAVGPDQQTIVQCGNGVDLANAAITQSGGTLTIDSPTGSGTIVQTGGIINVLSGAHAAITGENSRVNYGSSGTLTTLTLRVNGVAAFLPGIARTVTNCVLFADSSFLDPHGTTTVTNGWDFTGCGPNNLKAFQPGKHLTLTASAI